MHKTYVSFKGRFADELHVEEVSSRKISQLDIPEWAQTLTFSKMEIVMLDDGRIVQSETDKQEFTIKSSSALGYEDNGKFKAPRFPENPEYMEGWQARMRPPA